jgi:ArsR family transcriptional regulator
MNKMLKVLKALGEKNRLRVFVVLKHANELCVCQVADFLGLALGTVSRHMSILNDAGLIRSSKKGRWTYYSFAGDIDPILMEWVNRAVENDPSVPEDIKRIEAILDEYENEKHPFAKARKNCD